MVCQSDSLGHKKLYSMLHQSKNDLFQVVSVSEHIDYQCMARYIYAFRGQKQGGAIIRADAIKERIQYVVMTSRITRFYIEIAF